LSEKSFTMTARLYRVGRNYRFRGLSNSPSLPAPIVDCYIEAYAMGAPPPSACTITVAWDSEPDTEDDDES